MDEKQGAGTSEYCVEDPVRDPPPQPIDICDDGSGTGQCSPIVINVENGSYRMSGPDDPVDFDIDGDGWVNRITWTGRNSGVAFLAMDRNNNARIDNGAELFGNWTPLGSGERAANGFVALNEIDTNGDAVVNVLDEAWPSLLLWIDANHDGVSQPEELRSLAVSTVRGIETSYYWTGRRDSAGNFFRYQGIAYLDRGRRSIYDVYFRSVP